MWKELVAKKDFVWGRLAGRKETIWIEERVEVEGMKRSNVWDGKSEARPRGPRSAGAGATPSCSGAHMCRFLRYVRHL